MDFSTNRDIPVVLKALGRKEFPRELVLPSGRYELIRVFKHDFFAATGLLGSEDDHLVVLKIGRMANFLGLPGRWLGRLLAHREARLYQALADLPAVPAFICMWKDCGFVHEYVPGHQLQSGEAVCDSFFDNLNGIIESLHARGIAYVDLEKCENIIVGDDGGPHLIDFQISWHMDGWWGRRFPLFVWIRRVLQRMDEYHLLKHRRRARPDQLNPEELEESHKLPGHIKIHRALVRPLQKIRRGVLRRVDSSYSSARR